MHNSGSIENHWVTLLLLSWKTTEAWFNNTDSKIIFEKRTSLKNLIISFESPKEK